MVSGQVTLERRGKVALITLDRVERHNAMNESMWASLEAVVEQVEADVPRAVVMTGAGGKAFCAGMDVNLDNPQIAGLIDAVRTHDRAPVERMLRRLRNVVDRLVGLPVPVIAALNGLAYGGGAELAVRSDLRVADPEARICFSEVTLGLMPDLGGGPALVRLVGPGRAADLILTARRVPADEALRLGVLDRISAPGQAREEALELANAIAKNGPGAIRSALEVIRRAGDMPLSEAIELEFDRAVALIASGECMHGIPAMLSRNEPDFPDI